MPLPDEAERVGVRQGHGGRRRRSTGASPTTTRRSSRQLTAGISLTDLNVIVQSAREGGRRLDCESVPRAEEAADRAAVPRPARVHRAEVDARHRRRTRGGQDAAARGRRAAQARRARQPADGLPALRAGRHRQIVPRAVRQRRDRRAVRDAQELPVEVRRRDRRATSSACCPCSARWARWSSSSTRPTRRSAAASRTATPARRAACSA